GLPGGQVRALQFTPDGTLWAGGSGGLARFQPLPGPPTAAPALSLSKGPGPKVRERFMATTNLSSKATVYCLELDEQGSLLIGTERGLFRYVDGELTTLFPAGPVLAVYAETNGVLWMGTRDGAIRSHGDSLTALTRA